MKDFIDSLSLGWAIAFLYAVVLCRAGGTYLIARAITPLAEKTFFRNFLESESVQKATVSLQKWGAPLVAVSFLTVGVQTAMNAAAGVIKMPLKYYLPALFIGGLAWAVVGATIGLAAFWLWIELFAESPLGASLLLALILALIIYFLRRRRLRRRNADRV